VVELTMPRNPFTLPGGARGFICSRTPRPRCACGKPSAFQCDAPTRRSNGTCSRHLFGLALLAAQLPLTMILWWPVIGRLF